MADVVGLALQLFPSIGTIAERRGSATCAFQRETVVADDYVSDAFQDWIVALDGIGEFAGDRPLKVTAHRFGRASPDIAPFQHRDGVSERTPIRRGQSRADCREIVAGYVR